MFGEKPVAVNRSNALYVPWPMIPGLTPNVSVPEAPNAIDPDAGLTVSQGTAGVTSAAQFKMDALVFRIVMVRVSDDPLPSRASNSTALGYAEKPGPGSGMNSETGMFAVPIPDATWIAPRYVPGGSWFVAAVTRTIQFC